MTEALRSSTVQDAILVVQTTFGVDDWLFVINLSLALIVLAIFRLVWWVPVACAAHAVLMIVTKVQPNILVVYVRHSLQADRYTPFATLNQRRSLRPQDFCRRAR